MYQDDNEAIEASNEKMKERSEQIAQDLEIVLKMQLEKLKDDNAKIENENGKLIEKKE